jgi:hypothetical protein
MAWLTGGWGGGTASGAAPGAADPDGTEYDWLDAATRCVNVASPWKDPATGSAGAVEAGHLIPGYYPTRLRYRFGVTDNATQEVELSGGAFFYGEFAPIEEKYTGDGNDTTFVTSNDTIKYRKGGAGGTVFRNVFGVMVDGTLFSEDVDYTVTGGDGSPATITFDIAPETGADIRVAYFTDAAQAYPQSVHASVVIVPGAVRGRNIHVYVNGEKVGGIQSLEMEATVDGEAERELGTEEVTGRVVNGTDANGTLTIRSRDAEAFFDVLEQVTGVDRSEIFGWFNEETVLLEIGIENPKEPGTLMKTIVVDDAKFQPPGTPARVNAATDFSIQWESLNGTFKERKGGDVVDLAA